MVGGWEAEGAGDGDSVGADVVRGGVGELVGPAVTEPVGWDASGEAVGAADGIADEAVG